MSALYGTAFASPSSFYNWEFSRATISVTSSMRAKPVPFWHQGEITKYFLNLRMINNNSNINYFKFQRSWANRRTTTKASKDSGPTRGRNSAENQTENGPHQSQPAKESAGPYTKSTENTFPRYFSYTTIFFFVFNTITGLYSIFIRLYFYWFGAQNSFFYSKGLVYFLSDEKMWNI